MSDWPKSPGNVEAALERSGRFIREQAAELDRLRAENARLLTLMREAMDDFHGKSVLFSASFLDEAERVPSARAALEGGDK